MEAKRHRLPMGISPDRYPPPPTRILIPSVVTRRIMPSQSSFISSQYTLASFNSFGVNRNDGSSDLEMYKITTGKKADQIEKVQRASEKSATARSSELPTRQLSSTGSKPIRMAVAVLGKEKVGAILGSSKLPNHPVPVRSCWEEYYKIMHQREGFDITWAPPDGKAPILHYEFQGDEVNIAKVNGMIKECIQFYNLNMSRAPPNTPNQRWELNTFQPQYLVIPYRNYPCCCGDDDCCGGESDSDDRGETEEEMFDKLMQDDQEEGEEERDEEEEERDEEEEEEREEEEEEERDEEKDIPRIRKGRSKEPEREPLGLCLMTLLSHVCVFEVQEENASLGIRPSIYEMQGGLLKKVVDAIKDLVSNANFYCSPDGFSIEAMDSSHVSLVALLLRLEGFEDYRCDRSLAMGMNVNNMAAVLKCAGRDDIVTITGDNDAAGGDNVNFVICKDLTTIGDTVTISVTEEGVKFCTRGDIGSATIVCRQNTAVDKPEDATVIQVNNDQPVSLTFSLRFLNSFTKASPLSNCVTINLSSSSEQSIVAVEYLIAEMGYIRFYLAPKADDGEDD
ncbi:OLC1v1004215C1 [Oldenlandia corymbosa var. corymbosa]|uniref:OLC1v1004215C1 n=1 Tax=Oldenlandia corymbosa var. corymbosa TaxID=529605 RepID=A0AAV1DCK0_OLDCO|nr:OLC1v1004215C1 [Oldenlandia corymbosa var. corymbosa]